MRPSKKPFPRLAPGGGDVTRCYFETGRELQGFHLDGRNRAQSERTPIRHYCGKPSTVRVFRPRACPDAGAYVPLCEEHYQYFLDTLPPADRAAFERPSAAGKEQTL
jgi:hypothetical protein